MLQVLNTSFQSFLIIWQLDTKVIPQTRSSTFELPIKHKQSTPGTTASSAGLFQGFMAALAGNKPKELSVKDLLKEELMTQLLNPPAPAIQPMAMFQNLLNTN